MYAHLINFLKHFVALDREEFSQLKQRITPFNFQKKELIIREGETAQYLYFINSGLIHQFFYKGKEVITTDLIAEGTITGSVSSFLSGKPSHYYLEAMEATSVLAMSKKNLDDLYRSDIKWQRFGRIFITHFLLQQEMHLLNSIRYSIRERFVQFGESNPEMLKRVPQRRLASYLDIKPETFSRLKPLLDGKNKTAPPKKMKK